MSQVLFSWLRLVGKLFILYAATALVFAVFAIVAISLYARPAESLVSIACASLGFAVGRAGGEKKVLFNILRAVAEFVRGRGPLLGH